MKNKAHNLKSYFFKKGEKILIDTNVWIYLYPPPSNPACPFAGDYSRTYASLILAGAIPILDTLILSEYLNLYCRIEWKARINKYPNYKSFRNSSEFVPIANTAARYASKFLSSCGRHQTQSDQLDMQNAINDFQARQLDINDSILTNICQLQNMKLLTNDGDFRSGGIEIITSNPILIRECK